MRIQVLRNYGGWNTGDQRILPGEYDIDDPRLFGVGRYLLETGEARVIAVDPPPVVDEETVIDTTAAVEFEPIENTRAVKRKVK